MSWACPKCEADRAQFVCWTRYNYWEPRFYVRKFWCRFCGLVLSKVRVYHG